MHTDSDGTREIRISLVMCTRNRAASLARALQALEQLTFDPAAWELIVVDNGSTDDSDRVVRAFAARVPFRVVPVFDAAPGVSNARNTGVRRAAASIIAFTDDDCYVEPDFLTRVLDAFADPARGYVGGRIVLHDQSDAPITIRVDDEAEEIPPGTVVRPGAFQSANLSFRREVFDAVGGFDPVLGTGQGFGGGEDTDFVRRASAAGWTGRYEPGPVVRHHHGRKPGPDVDRLLVSYARGRGACFVKGCLDPRMRGRTLRLWYWHARVFYRKGQGDHVVRELLAGLEYLWWRMTAGRKQSSPRETSVSIVQPYGR